MAERLAGSFVGDPGLEELCLNCPNHSEPTLSNAGYPCDAVKIDRFGEFSHRPQWVSDNYGSLTCSDIKRPLRERVLAKIATTSQFLAHHGIRLPQ